MAARILVVDDEKLIRWSLREHLTREGYEIEEAADASTAQHIIGTQELDLALVDLRLPDADGLTVLKGLRAKSPGTPVILITAYSSVNGAVEAMRSGAFDYVTKPFKMDDLTLTIQRALETSGLRRQLAADASDRKARFGLHNIVGRSARMTAIKDLVKRVARSEATTVLLLGESGTGKDMIARALHYESGRVDRPFVNVTCTALPESLLESELFGYEKGAFTDAKALKKGLFEFADGGTIFLDEIGDMRPTLQAKLLRVLEEKAFMRIGGTEDIRVDVRVIAATNRDIDEAMREGRFREDLYYRLSTVPVAIPPLRERLEDIPELAANFLRAYNQEFHRDFNDLAPEVLRKLADYHWPGNVRELRNVIERAALLAAGFEITENDIVLGRTAARAAASGTPRLVQLPDEGCDLEEVEKELLVQALRRTSGNRTQAAALLGVTRDQIRYKIEKHSLDL